MVHAHAASALHNRFKDHCRNFVAMCGHQTGKRHHIQFVPFAAHPTLRSGCKQVIRQITLPQTVHRVVRIADRHRAESIAVITVTKCQETLTGFTFGLPVLQRHFHRDFHGDRTRIREKNALQRLGRHRHQLATQRNSRGMGNAAKHHVRHGINLRFHRGIQLRVIVTVDCRPPG